MLGFGFGFGLSMGLGLKHGLAGWLASTVSSLVIFSHSYIPLLSPPLITPLLVLPFYFHLYFFLRPLYSLLHSPPVLLSRSTLLFYFHFSLLPSKFPRFTPLPFYSPLLLLRLIYSHSTSISVSIWAHSNSFYNPSLLLSHSTLLFYPPPSYPISLCR